MKSFLRKQYYVCRCSRFLVDEFKRRTRSFSSSSNNALSDHLLIDDHDSCVTVERNASSRTVVLNRPSFLNALNTPMGNGKAFCSGSDIVAMHGMIKEGNIEGSKEIFSRAYKFIYLIHTYLKPNVAILNGITMGGGAGISIPGTFRIATDKNAFATPEVLIGLNPDGGASYYLSHLPGYLGEYLALTGDILNGVEMMACGLATHYSHSTNIVLIEERLRNLITDDPCVIKTSLENYTYLDFLPSKSFLKRMETINKCFSHDTVEEIINALEWEAAKTHDKWCHSILKKLKYASPLSLKVSLRSIREGQFQTLDQCLIREYRLVSRAMSCEISGDFCEVCWLPSNVYLLMNVYLPMESPYQWHLHQGVRARMLDKDFAPKWNPPTLEHVSQDMVDEHFCPLSSLELELDNLPSEALSNELISDACVI
ncbi:ATP-dependent caseinolytic (Clp) protease/crotonase family protein [Artemisia annua]|uniref:3-hydroxyisobutyryl-CoA hydrolase n=1 Tax=Artemisia annua TaxID=35608 RepID=A0A2U1PV78_ARTAN|nr:ATP-dependent caseinolytic (Clp) protease/crotonase family protein [Artemisia annua]